MCTNITQVCMLSFSHNPYDGRIYHKESKSLAKYGYSVSILSLHNGNMQKPLENNIKLDSNIKVRHVKVFHKNIYILFFIKLYKLFREALKVNAEIYHCHEPESHLVGLALKILKGKKVVLDVHEYYPDVIELSGRYYKYFYMLICYVIEPLFCRLDDCIVCADNEIKQLYRKFNKTVITLFNFPVIEQWDLKDNLSAETDRTNHTLIYTGSICQERGIWLMLSVIVELVKVFVDVKLVLLGDLSNDLKEEINHYITSKCPEGCIEYIGNIPHTEVTKYLRASSVGLLLYQPINKFCKNIPTKQYEYAISGLPFVGTDLPPIRKFIDEAKCGLLIAPGNIEDAVNAVKFIFTHPDEARKMGENGKKAVDKKFNWAFMECKLIDAYSRI